MSEAVLIGGEQTADSAAVEATDGPTQETSEASGTDLVERMMSDREFAEEQIRKREQQISRLSNEVKELDPVAQLAKVAGGTDQLMQLMALGNDVVQTPGLMDVVTSAKTAGRYEPPATGSSDGQQDSDEWIDPDVAAATAPLKQELAEVKAQLQEMSGVLGAANVRSMQSRIEENVEGALSMFASDEGAMAEARQVLESEIKAAMAAAERGDPQQAKLIESLSTPAGKKTLETALFDTYRKHAAKLVAGTSDTTTPSEPVALGRQTDERPNTVTRPGASELPPRPKGRQGADYALKVLQAAGRQKGVDTRHIF